MVPDLTGSDPKALRPAANLPGRLNRIAFAPSILAGDFANLEREIRKVRRAGCRWIHVDVMDGHFVPNLTIGPPVVKSIARAVPEMFYDTHLMVEQPLRLARDFIEAGASLVTVHLEASDDPVAVCRHLRRKRVRVGISIRPKTPYRLLAPVLPLVDLVLIMTVEPGFGGQELIPQTLNKVRQLKQLREEQRLGFLIQVDGGINASNIRLVASAGPEVLVMGTAVFRGGEVEENIRRLRESLAGVAPLVEEP